MSRRRPLRCLLLAVLLGCEGVPGAPTSVPVVPGVAGVHLSADRTLLDLGETVQARARLVTANGDTVAAGAAVVWSSTDPTVATVSATGTVQARLEGRTEVVARAANGVTGRLALDVVPVSARTLVITPRDTVMFIPDAAVLTATVRARDGRDLGYRNVYWSVVDTSLVRVVRITENTIRVYPQGKGVVEVNGHTIDGVTGQTRLRMEPDTIHDVEFDGPRSVALSTNEKPNNLTIYAVGRSARGRLVPATTVSYWMSRHDVLRAPHLFSRADGATGVGFELLAPGTVQLIVTLDGIQEIVTLEVRPAESCSALFPWLCAGKS